MAEDSLPTEVSVAAKDGRNCAQHFFCAVGQQMKTLEQASDGVVILGGVVGWWWWC